MTYVQNFVVLSLAAIFLWVWCYVSCHSQFYVCLSYCDTSVTFYACGVGVAYFGIAPSSLHPLPFLSSPPLRAPSRLPATGAIFALSSCWLGLDWCAAIKLNIIAGIHEHSVKSIVNRIQGMSSPTGPGPGAVEKVTANGGERSVDYI